MSLRGNSQKAKVKQYMSQKGKSREAKGKTAKGRKAKVAKPFLLTNQYLMAEEQFQSVEKHVFAIQGCFSA